MKINNPQFLFMAEAEGVDSLANTRTAQINAVIREIRNYPKEMMPEEYFIKILSKHHLEDLTTKELDFIQKAL